jgi:hypothetical protein
MTIPNVSELTAQIIARAGDLRDAYVALETGEQPEIMPEMHRSEDEDDLAPWLRVAANELAPDWDWQVFVPAGGGDATIQLTYYRQPRL